MSTSRSAARAAAPFAFAVLSCLVACGDDSGSSGGQIGDSCDPDKTMSCAPELICALDADDKPRCAIPAGGECDAKAKEPGCELNSLCVVVSTDEEGKEMHECRMQSGGSCDPERDDAQCDPSLRCAERQDGSYACYLPFQIAGQVMDSADLSAIEGAHVIGLDEQSIAVTDVAVSDADGGYVLELPVVRDAEGNPLDAAYTLRASALDYQTFPGGLRTALPIHTSDAEKRDEGWVVDGTLAEIILIALPNDGSTRYSISGHILGTELQAGVLVVAEQGGVGISGISDRGGAYTIFNVVDGGYEVSGYAAGLQLTPVSASVAGGDLMDVDLTASDRGLTRLEGTIQIVNAFGGAATSVVLVVESTFDMLFVRGEVPPGLRAPQSGPPSITGAFTIPDVPDGNYVVLAAFENDRLVRDPDTNIAGTDFVTVSVPGAASGGVLTLSESFKVTEALAVISPGADLPDAVSSAPTLRFADDSSEDWYEVQVFNAHGEMVWENLDVPSVSGAEEVSVSYGGPLEAGMYYQFRARSMRAPGGNNPAPISTTEDLLGVFYVDQ
ncbi:MAG: carboxypeptidase-like regulatory domain-containing protein [Myxococcales bacterium]|nr:carboxypeptidase-like regulatory domain-containing protein [Myxococcales bacterium]